MTSRKPTCMAHAVCHCDSHCPPLLVFNASEGTDTMESKGSHALHCLETGGARSGAHAQGRSLGERLLGALWPRRPLTWWDRALACLAAICCS